MQIQLYIFSFLLYLLNSVCYSFKYTLPNDNNWPTNQEFLNFKQSLDGKVTLRGDQDYKPITYNLRTNNPKPAAIAYVNDLNDIQKSLEFAKQYGIRISVYSTGHHQDIRNTADNSIQINLQNLKRKSINLEEKTVTVETGNIFGDILEYVYTESQGTLVCLTGADSSVGPYGWVTGGGHGRLTRMYGLGVDALKSIDLLLVNGSQVTASEYQNQDLFRSLRGSGGSTYGIATNITFSLYPSPGKVSQWQGVYLPNNSIANRFSDWYNNSPNNIAAYYMLNNSPQPSVTIRAVCFGDQQNCSNIFQPLGKNCLNTQEGDCKTQYFDNILEFQKTVRVQLGQTSSLYLVSTAFQSENLELGLINANKFFRDNLKDDIGEGGCSGNAVLGGVSSQIDTQGKDTSVAPALRQSVMAITCFTNWGAGSEQLNPIKQQEIIEKMEKFSDEILKKYGMDEFVYWNEPNHLDDHNTEWQKRYWGSQNNNYQQMLQVKKKYDPDNFLTCYQCVGWDQTQETDPTICPDSQCSCSNTLDGQCSQNPNINNFFNQLKGSAVILLKNTIKFIFQKNLF